MYSCIKALGSRVILVCLLTSLGACHVVHLRKDAPGDVDVLSPPEDLETQATQVPDDPGEEVVVMTLGLSNASGSLINRSGRPRVSYQLIIESSFAWYDVPESPVLRPEMDWMMPGEVGKRLPGSSFTQLNLGLSPLEVTRDGAHLGPVYAELQRTFILPHRLFAFHTSAIAAGYVYHSALKAHGPQLTVSFLGNLLSLRGAYFLDRGAFLGGSLNLKIPAVILVKSQ
jgi:hypothetical protein